MSRNFSTSLVNLRKEKDVPKTQRIVRVIRQCNIWFGGVLYGMKVENQIHNFILVAKHVAIRISKLVCNAN